MLLPEARLQRAQLDRYIDQAKEMLIQERAVHLDFLAERLRDPRVKRVSQEYQMALPAPEFAWKRSDGSLDMDTLLREFQDFWQHHSDIWEAKADYTEAFPHLLLMAFLQRVVNGGGQDAWPSSENREAISRPGRVEREYAAGRGRMDLAIHYGGKWNIIEIKLVNHRGRDYTVQKGLEQILTYRDRWDNQAECRLLLRARTEAGKPAC